MTLSASDLVGAWRLVSATEVFADGVRMPEFGPHVNGYLSYSPDGIVSATLGSTDRIRTNDPDPQSVSTANLALMAGGFLAYAGPYTVDSASDTVTHHVDIALFTGWEGKPQTRHARVEGNDLFITGSPRTTIDGLTFHSELHWTRVTARATQAS